MRFTKDHEWLKLEGDIALVGITEHASTLLGDIVFIEMVAVSGKISKGDEIAVIESVKAASEICAPIDGELVEVNEAIVETPHLVNDDPMGHGWFSKMKVSDVSALDGFMDSAAYQAFVG